MISIILPTRNRLTTIRRTVDRILAQTVSDWELVVSDNASEEAGKLEYLRELETKDDRVRVFAQETNIGIHKNWRFCIERIRGRYYIAVTDDDWWGEDDYLEKLLAAHDGSTGSAFPNMCMHLTTAGEDGDVVVVEDRALSAVYGGVTDRYRKYEGLVRDGKGAIMIGLIDTQVVARSEIIEAIDNDRVVCIETLGMHRIARSYPMQFVEDATYHHPEYADNYSKTFDMTQRLQDIAIVNFEVLDEIRKAAREDPGFEESLRIHWETCQRICMQLWHTSGNFDDLITRAKKQRERIKTLQAEVRELRQIQQRRSNQVTLGMRIRNRIRRLVSK